MHSSNYRNVRKLDPKSLKRYLGFAKKLCVKLVRLISISMVFVFVIKTVGFRGIHRRAIEK